MYDSIFTKIALAKIEEAIKNGEFDHLPGQGKRVNLDCLELVPPEMRMAYSLLCNSGYLPEAAMLLKEIAEVREELQRYDNAETAAANGCEGSREHEEKRNNLIKTLRDLELKYALAMEKGG